MSAKQNSGTFQTIKEILERQKDGKTTIDPEIRDLLLFSAIVSIYETLEKMEPVFTFYQIGMYFASALGISVLMLLFGLLTGQVALTFSP